MELLKEKAIDAIKREIKEELNIDFQPKFQFYGENIFSNPDLHCHILYFAGEYTGEMQIKSDEITEIKFFSVDEIKRENEIAWDHKEVLLDYVAK